LKACLLLCLMTSAVAFGADDSINLLQDASARLDKWPITTGRFSQTAAVAALSAPLVSTGSFYFDRDRGVVWHVEQPISAHFVFRPTQDDAHPAANPLQMGWVGQLLNAILAGDLTVLDRMFQIGGSLPDDGWALTLTPKSAAVKRALAKIDIDGGASIHQIRLFEANGDDVTIVFSDVQHPAELPADIGREFAQTP
jgi:hypothetical protein